MTGGLFLLSCTSGNVCGELIQPGTSQGNNTGLSPSAIDEYLSRRSGYRIRGKLLRCSRVSSSVVSCETLLTAVNKDEDISVYGSHYDWTFFVQSPNYDASPAYGPDGSRYLPTVRVGGGGETNKFHTLVLPQGIGVKVITTYNGIPQGVGYFSGVVVSFCGYSCDAYVRFKDIVIE